jgi:uncharacterized Ntn-hydrolase superfamily protein
VHEPQKHKEHSYLHVTGQILEKDEYVSKVAHSFEEACKLIDKGFKAVDALTALKFFAGENDHPECRGFISWRQVLGLHGLNSRLA